MAGEEEKSCDFYAILGVKKECSAVELRNAYKKLALKWHPDRFSANPSYMDEAKKKFQAVQQAFSVLSDANKRFLYDLGMYDEDDDDESGMGDFMNEMVEMMCQSKSNDKGNETFEELQGLFVEMFASDMEAFSSSSRSSTPFSCSSSQASSCEPYSFPNMRNSSGMNFGNLGAEATHFQGFCIGTGGTSGKHQVTESGRRKNSSWKC